MEDMKMLNSRPMNDTERKLLDKFAAAIGTMTAEQKEKMMVVTDTIILMNTLPKPSATA